MSAVVIPFPPRDAVGDWNRYRAALAAHWRGAADAEDVLRAYRRYAARVVRDEAPLDPYVGLRRRFLTAVPARGGRRA